MSKMSGGRRSVMDVGRMWLALEITNLSCVCVQRMLCMHVVAKLHKHIQHHKHTNTFACFHACLRLSHFQWKLMFYDCMLACLLAWSVLLVYIPTHGQHRPGFVDI